MTNQPTYLFSVIIPAYNCEDYVEDAILSIVEQDIGFEQNIQLILVNDGSTDGTAAICEQYAELFPNNVVYVHKQNGGVSLARKTGLTHAQGTYVNFLDADDMWSLDACSCARSFFRRHSDVNICAARHYYFEAQSGPHPLDYKFERTRVIDLRTTYDYPQLAINDLFIRRDLVKPDLFDARLQVSEDFLMVNLMLFDQMKYGVMKRPTYWYRKRQAGGSAIDASHSNLSWYFDTPRYCYRRLFDESLVRFGCVLPHIQHAVMYDLQWRIKKRMAHPLSEQQLAEYRCMIVELLQEIDDEIILAQRHISRTQKLNILALKHGMEVSRIQSELIIKDGMCMWRKTNQACGTSECENAVLPLWPVASEARAVIQFIRREGNDLVLEGKFSSVLPLEELRFQASYAGQAYHAVIEPRLGRRYDSFFDRMFFTESGFNLRIPIGGNGAIKFTITLNGTEMPVNLRSGSMCPISFRLFDYTLLGDVMLCTVPRMRDRLLVKAPSRARVASRELLYEATQLAVHPQTRPCMRYRRTALAHVLGRDEQTSQIWLIFDRTVMAGDNGEALFRYLAQHPQPNVEPYFVINEDAPDFERMQAYGKVVPYGSHEHKQLHARASLILSASADDHILNLFGRQRYLIRNFESYRFVFLQHGVILHDLSNWLNRFNKDIALFITSAPRERESITGNPVYGYTNKQVVLTGLARHDRLLAQAASTPVQRRILIAPTWRQSLAGPTDVKTGWRLENPAFAESSYYQFYQALLNHPKLKERAAALGYTVDFFVHPALAQEAHKFSSSFASIKVGNNYADEFTTSAVLVTDYSSVAFDFALLKKPILYVQYDKGKVLDAHMWEFGYFDYERDGFGDICTTLDGAADAIIDLMQDPQMPQKFQRRVDEFFYRPAEGTSRCQAIVQAVQDMKDV